MINPGLFGVSQQALEQARSYGNYVEARLVKRRSERLFSVEFLPRVSEEELREAGVDLEQMVDQMVQLMATQLHAFLGIGGVIRNVE